MPGKFVVKKGSTGKFRFSLHSTNGQIVVTSEAYNTKASAMGGIRSVKSQAADAEIEDQTTKEWAAGEGARKVTASAKKATASAKKATASAKKAKAGAKKETATKTRTWSMKVQEMRLPAMKVQE